MCLVLKFTKVTRKQTQLNNVKFCINVFFWLPRAQMHVLVENGKCQSINETVLLVQVRHVIDYMPQLKYMLVGNMTAMPKRS